jgi:hypothetical protein
VTCKKPKSCKQGLSWKDTARGARCKTKEKLQRQFVKDCVLLLNGFHRDLSFELRPDRRGEVDILIKTKYGEHRAELKANDSDWEYRHGTPKNTWSNEYNFVARNATIIIGTQHTILPEDNIIPIVMTPPPRQLARLEGRRERWETVRGVALRLERKFYPEEERRFQPI